eukprot:2582840-Amphidinium_carterae.1
MLGSAFQSGPWEPHGKASFNPLESPWRLPNYMSRSVGAQGSATSTMSVIHHAAQPPSEI